MLTKAKNVGRVKDEESVNIAEDDALGYRIGDEFDEIDEALLAGAFNGACHFCNKKGHFKKDCVEFKEKLLKIRK